MDPRPFTLAEVYRLAVGREQAAWEHTVTLLAPWAGKDFDPLKLLPGWLRPDAPAARVKSAAEAQAESELGFRLLIDSVKRGR